MGHENVIEQDSNSGCANLELFLSDTKIIIVLSGEMLWTITKLYR